MDHFIQPLPVVGNDDQMLVPDQSEVCVDDADTGCLAWDAAVEMLAQAPTAFEAETDRRIGMSAEQRRVTYAQAASGSAVPRSIATFDYSDSDLIDAERDLWTGMGIAFITGEPDAEEIATNADPLGGQGTDRARTVEGFAGKPVVTNNGFTMQAENGDEVDPFEATEIQGVRNSLMSLFPADCRFGSFSLNISSSLSSREMMPLAQIPVCIARKNWSEH